MHRIVAVILVMVLLAPPAWAGQTSAKPIARSKLPALAAGTKVTLTVRDQPPTNVRFLFADEATVVTLKPTSVKLGKRVEHILLGFGFLWPGILNRGESVEDDRVRVSQNGIFDGDRKVCDLADVVQQTPREDVLSIAEPPHSHALRNFLIGAAIAVATVFIAMAASGYWED